MMSQDDRIEQLEAEVAALRLDVLDLVKVCRSLNQMDMQGVLLLMIRTSSMNGSNYQDEFKKFSAEQHAIRQALIRIENRTEAKG